MPHNVTEDRGATEDRGESRSERRGRRQPHDSGTAPMGLEEAEAEQLETCPGVRRLSSPAMMAELLGVPPAAVRHWIRTGLLQVAERSGSLEWLDYGQLVAGRRLASLLGAGLSLREIDAQLAGLGDGRDRPVVTERMVVDGRRLSIVRDGRLLGAGGQLHLGFYADAAEIGPTPADADDAAAILAFREWHRAPHDGRTAAGSAAAESDGPPPGGDIVAEILDLADDLEAAGDYVEAAEALRAVLQAQGPSAEVNVMLAELLYRSGDLTAARERYYAAIELDSEHLRARANLGCVLAELGEPELALAALEGVLRQEPEYADAHWHVAGVLRELGREPESRRHLRRFIELAPQSPWVDVARHRLEDA